MDSPQTVSNPSSTLLKTLGLVAILCLFPLLFFVGLDFGSTVESFDIQNIALWQLSAEHLQDEMYYALRAGVHHILIEWSAVIIAAICMFVSWMHYRTTWDLTALVIGVTLLLSAMMDVLHTVAATRLLDTISEIGRLENFTWALSRIFNATVLLFGAIFIILHNRKIVTLQKNAILVMGLFISLLLLLVGRWITNDQTLPLTYFPDNFITRPYDFLPLVIYFSCVPLLYYVYKHNKNYLTLTVFLSLFPAISGEFFIGFYSYHEYDHFFNCAHFLKIFSYSLPLAGYLMDYQKYFQFSENKSHYLSEVNKSLQDSKVMRETVYRMMPVGILMVGNDGLIKMCNQAVSKYFGYTETELLQMCVDDLVPQSNRKSHSKVRSNYMQASTMRSMGQGSELFGLHKDGREIPLEIGLAPVEITGIKHILVSIVDVSDRAQLLSQLHQNNAMLDASVRELSMRNEQLENFAYVCSHDLKEPIRMVQSFSQLLQISLAGSLTETQDKYVNFIKDGAERAGIMINDILGYSQLSQTAGQIEKVKLEEICLQVSHALSANLKEHNAHFTWEDSLPELTGLNSHFYQLLLNLVGNGIKFNKSISPEVHISYAEEDNAFSIFIDDNGIGIEAKYRDKVFDMFKRLHTKDDFPGTGIGLASCRKIARQHHASLDIVDAPHNGARFVLRWPKINTVRPDAHNINKLVEDPYNYSI